MSAYRRKLALAHNESSTGWAAPSGIRKEGEGSMDTFRRPARLGLIAAVALVATTACGGDDGDDEAQVADESPDTASDGAGEADQESSELDQLVAAAQEEGSLTFYSVPDESIAQGISEEFTDRYDIEVEFVRLVTADLAQRFSAEASSGAPAADMILVTDSPFLTEAFGEGWLTPINEAGLPDYGEFPEEFIVRDGATAIVSINPTVLGYNTDIVAEEPEDWTVLADPEWSGQIAMSDPTTSVANLFFWDLIRQTYGDEFLEEIAANEPMFTAGAVPSAQSVGAGEVAFGVPAVSAIYENLAGEGAPVAYASPEVTTGAEVAVGIAAEAENPNAARLFAHFLLTQEGADLLNLPYGTASPYGGNLPAEYSRPDPSALEREELIYDLLGAN